MENENREWKAEKMQMNKIGIGAKVFSGYAFKSNEFAEEGVPVIKIGNIQNRVVEVNRKQCVKIDLKNEKTEKFILKDKDVFIS